MNKMLYIIGAEVMNVFLMFANVYLVVVVVNFIKHQNRAITGERVAARAALFLTDSRQI